jgi:hypothetical protein
MHPITNNRIHMLIKISKTISKAVELKIFKVLKVSLLQISKIVKK